jgi:hypothetical protein
MLILVQTGVCVSGRREGGLCGTHISGQRGDVGPLLANNHTSARLGYQQLEQLHLGGRGGDATYRWTGGGGWGGARVGGRHTHTQHGVMRGKNGGRNPSTHFPARRGRAEQSPHHRHTKRKSCASSRCARRQAGEWSKEEGGRGQEGGTKPEPPSSQAHITVGQRTRPKPPHTRPTTTLQSRAPFPTPSPPQALSGTHHQHQHRQGTVPPSRGACGPCPPRRCPPHPHPRPPTRPSSPRSLGRASWSPGHHATIQQGKTQRLCDRDEERDGGGGGGKPFGWLSLCGRTLGWKS